MTGASKESLPAILSRPSSNCFLLNLDALKVLCEPERCLILHPDDGIVENCVKEMQASKKKYLKCHRVLQYTYRGGYLNNNFFPGGPGRVERRLLLLLLLRRPG